MTVVGGGGAGGCKILFEQIKSNTSMGFVWAELNALAVSHTNRVNRDSLFFFFAYSTSELGRVIAAIFFFPQRKTIPVTPHPMFGSQLVPFSTNRLQVFCIKTQSGGDDVVL